MHDWNSVYSTLAGEIYGVERKALRAALDLACAGPHLRVSELLVNEGHLNRKQDHHLRSLVDRLLSASENGVSALEYGEGINRPASASQSRYTVRSVHARGGIGRVLLGWDAELEREVAIKELQGTPPPHVVERFLREARITARLEHPSIIPIYEILKRPDGSPYYAMKLVRGTTLREAIEERSGTRDRLSLLPHFVDLCQAIGYAHSRGVIHRDIKSSNVMIGEFGETLVIDWGLAKHITDPTESDGASRGDGDDNSEGDGLTVAGHVMGTPNYMPPEQALGELEKVDQRSDVYALGAVLYELLCGSPPLSDQPRSVVVRRASQGEVAPIDELAPDAPRALIAICRKAMAFAPEDRYTSAGSLAEDVSRFQSGLLVQAHRYGPIARALRVVRRHRAIVATAAAFLIVLAVTGALSYASIERAREREAVLLRETEKRRYDAGIVEAHRYVEGGHLDEAAKALSASPASHRSWEWGRLQRILNDATHILPHEGASVWTGAISPDGRLLITTDELTIVLWDLATGKEIRKVYTPGTSSIDFHPSGEEFASSDDKGRAFLWDLETFSVKQSLLNHEHNADLSGRRQSPDVKGVRYTPDGNRVLTAGTDGHAILWDRATGQPLRQWEFDNAEFMRIEVQPEGTLAAAGLFDGRVLVWDFETGQKRFEVQKHAPGDPGPNNLLGGAMALAFSLDGETLFTAGGAVVAILNVLTGEPLGEQQAHRGDVSSITGAPDGILGITTSFDGTVQLWDSRNATKLPSHYQFPFHVNEALVTPDGESMVLCTQDGTASVWPLRNRFGEFVLQGHSDEVFALDFSPDGSMLVSGAGHWEYRADNRVMVWDIRTGRQTFVLSGHESAVFHAEFFPDGRRVLTVSRDHGVIIWDAVTGRLLKTLPSLQDYYGISSVALSPDGRSFIAAGWHDRRGQPCEVALWRTDDGAMIRQLKGAEGHVEAVAFSPDGSRVGGATSDGMWSLWDVETGNLLLTSGGPPQKYQSLVFAPDGSSIMTVGATVPIQLWDATTGELLRDFVANHPIMERATFSPDGKRIVTCHTAGIRILEAETGNVFATLPFPARNVVFSPDGLFLAAGCVDHTVRVWQALPWDRDYDGTYWTDYEARVENAKSR